MKYRVKFKCYWYNTGAADNHSYINHEDFDTLEEAEKFRDKINEQYNMGRKSEHQYKGDTAPNSFYEAYGISEDEYRKWRDSFKCIEIENGFIESEATIVKFFPETESAI